jgi:hypothetical protein
LFLILLSYFQSKLKEAHKWYDELFSLKKKLNSKENTSKNFKEIKMLITIKTKKMEA